MLQHMRDNSKGVISGILIGLLVIIFAISGAEALFKWDASEAKAIKVNGEKITEADIARAIQNKKQEIISRYGESVPADFLTDEKLRQPVVDNLIKEALITQVAKKGGLAFSAAAITEEIKTTPALQKDGQFDAERFSQILRYQGYTFSTYVKDQVERRTAFQLSNAVASTSFVTPAELKNIIGLNFQTRDFSYLVLSAEKAEKSINISDAEIKAYYDANPKSYTTPEQVAVDYIELSIGELTKQINVTDEQVQKQYEQNTKAFVAKTERQAAHILFEGADAQKKADEVKAKLSAGEDFAKLAKEFSSDAGSKDQGGDLGFTSGDSFPKEFEDALAKLKVGEISAPVKSEAGVHIIKLISERGSKAPSFEESKASIVDQLKRSEAEAQFAAKLEKLKDLSYNAENLNDVAKELDLTAQNTGLFARAGGKDLTATPAFVNAAFSQEVLEQGNSSDIIELESNRVVVVKKTDRKAEQLQPLELVKEQVASVVRAEKTQALLAEQAKAIIAGVNEGKLLADQAKALGVDVKSASGVGRADKDTDRDVLHYAFGLGAPEAGKVAAGSVKTGKGDLAVVALSAVKLAGFDKVPAEQRSVISNQLANINGENEFKSLQAKLEEVAKIKRK